jgi:hypothetical protein
VSENDNFRFVIPCVCFHPQQSTKCLCIWLVIAWSFSEKDCVCNEPKIQSCHSRVHFPWILVRGVLNQVQYFTSPRCVRRWTKNEVQWRGQHRYGFSISRFLFCLLYLLLFSFVRRLFTNCVFFSFFFFFFFLVSFQVPLTSCASPWRAGETRNGASPKYFPYYLKKICHVIHCATFMLLVLQGDVFDLCCLRHLCIHKFMW